MKLSTAIRRFDAQMKADGKRPHTRVVYLRDIGAFRKWLRRDVPVRTITPNHLARYLASKRFTHTSDGRPKQAITLNRSKSALRSFFRFLTDSGYTKTDPARLVRHSRVTRKPPTPLTAQQANKLLSTIRKDGSPIARRDHMMFSLMLGTGIRLGALVAIDTGDVDLRQSTIRVVEKGPVERCVFLSTGLKRELRTYRKTLECADGPLFLSANGRRIGARQVQLRLDHWIGRAGIKQRCTVHTLRHTFATRLYEQTGDLRLVQRALGHRNVTTTEIYTFVADARLKRAVQAI